MDLDELESYDLEDKDGELTDEEARRARFRLLGPLGQGHNIVVHIVAGRHGDCRILSILRLSS
jgi:hypothetical protein